MFDWPEYQVLAQELVQGGLIRSRLEARLRSAISRSYYATFCVARNQLCREGIHIPRRDTHKFVWGEFKKSTELQRKKIGVNGSRLAKDRAKADYDDAFPGLNKQVFIDLDLAQQILAVLSNLPS